MFGCYIVRQLFYLSYFKINRTVKLLGGGAPLCCQILLPANSFLHVPDNIKTQNLLFSFLFLECLTSSISQPLICSSMGFFLMSQRFSQWYKWLTGKANYFTGIKEKEMKNSWRFIFFVNLQNYIFLKVHILCFNLTPLYLYKVVWRFI